MAGLITQLHYPTVQSWYNSERRLQKGNMTYYKDSAQYTYFSQMQEFHLNATGTDSSNRNTVTLFTFANGVKINFNYFTSGQSETTVGISGDIQYVGIDDSVFYSNYISIGSSVNYASVSDFPIWFNPTCTNYDGRPNPSQGEAAAQLHYYDIYYIRNNLPPDRTPITLNGEIRDYQSGIMPGWSQWYMRSTDWLYNASQYDQFLNQIEGKGDGTTISPVSPSDDTSKPDGGDENDPDYNPFTDPIPFPDLPIIGAFQTGLITAYNPGVNQLRQLGSKLWSDAFFNEIKKIQNDPMEAVISLHMLPFNVISSGTANCMIGNYNSEITMPIISTQFMSVDGGEITVNERFASALDYSPYTSVHIHIPFVGIVPLDIDFIMKKHLTLKYQVDVLTGGGTALLMCNDAILYTFPCNMAMTIPISSSNHQALYREIIQTSAQLGHTVVGAANPTTDRHGAMTSGAKASIGHGVVSTLESALNTVASKHSEVQKSGAITGVQGILDSFETYLIFHRPIQSLAERFGHFKGFPCNITYTLSALSGYTEVEYAHLEGVTATDEEKDELQALLQGGVIL